MNNYKQTHHHIMAFLERYIMDTQCKGFCIGISGGKDSTIVAKLLCDAIGKENVHGVLMPNFYQDPDSDKVIEYLGIGHSTINIGEINKKLLSEIESTDILATITDAVKFNIQPRLRMTALYALAQLKGYRVAGTGNKSEEFLGWCTKWGDMACDINPIAHLLCTEVIELGKYLDIPKELLYKTPSDGLTGKTDEDNFGFTYEHLDEFIKSLKQREGFPLCIEYNRHYEDERHTKMFEMHKQSRHKHKPFTL